MMNKKGYTVFGVVIVAGIFLVAWLFFFGSWMNAASQMLSDAVGDTGLEGFIADNFSLIIFGLFLVATMYFGARAG
jgi:hypothetical protein